MKNLFPALTIIIFLFGHSVSGQTTEVRGKPIAEIFTDFHLNLNDTTEKTGFGLNRAYLGYEFLPEGSFSGKVILNLGSPEDLPAGAEPRRYAFIREASITWSGKDLTISMGITGTRIFVYQQKFWGKRYIAKPYQAINGYGFVADLGVAVDYKISDLIKVDLTIMNGEGYNDIQLDNNIRTSAGINITPGENLVFRLYGDIQQVENLWQPVFIAFAGFRNDLLYFGGEASYKSNIDLSRGHHVWGISATGGFNLNPKTELFGRFDYVTSVVMPDDILKWNFHNDGNFVIAGVQYSFNQYVKAAFNYQGRYPWAPGGLISDLFYLNAIFRF
jgi:hypothetical protein